MSQGELREGLGLSPRFSKGRRLLSSQATFTILVSNQDFPVSNQFHHVQVKLIIGDNENVSERALYVGMTFITSRMPDSILGSAKKDITRRN